ncbi:fatty acid desaturase [Paenibacillus piri]|uniref:Fatty acid desaturase n=1 Tax=Paenibacillus piri TaxID=2547395 RepID=A0A4R5K6C2_9BACL|nr:fatty acid desaturase [Paenibacillus piri]TDF89441.1 fatty acid desaturase [Paenibacillus piri]
MAAHRSKNIYRDYSLTGPECDLAKEAGLVDGSWYTCPIPRQRLKELMKRRNGPAIRQTLIWFVSLIAAGFLAYYSWGTWWVIPAFLLYGTLFTVPAVACWHECSHGTVFKTPWMNEALYQITSFMIMASATNFRWSHVRHHTNTAIVGCDRESPQRPARLVAPPMLVNLALNLFPLKNIQFVFRRYFQHCIGKVNEEEKVYVPSSEHRKMFLETRISLLIYLTVVGVCVYSKSLLPAMFIGLPIFYGAFLNVFLITSQHHGLREDVLDHRLNTRTFYTNPIIRFLYWNMNYHIEHHMFPMVPFHALPALHEEIKADCPEPNRGLPSAFKESISAMIEQLKDPLHSVTRPLPITARPYKYGINK